MEDRGHPLQAHPGVDVPRGQGCQRSLLGEVITHEDVIPVFEETVGVVARSNVVVTEVWTPIEIAQPFGACMMLVLAWFSGCAVGMVLLALKPWLPKGTAIIMQIYSRANMFASGKMFVANTLQAHMVAMFAWNPLFHIIDQGRGFIFLNYNPMKSSLMYPLWVSLVLLAIGIIGVFYTSRRASLSWDAAR